MNLTEQDLKKIKALHVMIKMPVWIVAGDTGEVLKKYVSIYRQPISYEFRRKDVSGDLIRFYSGALNEIFLGIRYKEVQIVIGAFRINNVTKRAFSLVYDNLSGRDFDGRGVLGILFCTALLSAGRRPGLPDSSGISF